MYVMLILVDLSSGWLSEGKEFHLHDSHRETNNLSPPSRTTCAKLFKRLTRTIYHFAILEAILICLKATHNMHFAAETGQQNKGMHQYEEFISTVLAHFVTSTF